MDDLIERNALEAKIRENSMRIRFFDPSVNCILHLIRYAPAVNRWISCSERLPYIGVDVIVYVRTWREHKVQFGYRYSEKTWSVANIGVPNDEITFWMPLPEPPEKE